MQARGNIFSNNHIRVNYVSWFSKRQNRFSLNGTRAIGDRVEIFFPNKRIEVDASFTRRLQDARYNNYGAHFTWLPYSSPLQVRGEYAHNPNSQGYWIENSYRLSKFHGVDSFIGRIEPIFRFQQAFRNTAGPADGLPRVDTKIADFGLDYNLPHDVRIKSSYSRKFAQGADGNIWNLSVTYRFLYPAWPGKKQCKPRAHLHFRCSWSGVIDERSAAYTHSPGKACPRQAGHQSWRTRVSGKLQPLPQPTGHTEPANHRYGDSAHAGSSKFERRG